MLLLDGSSRSLELEAECCCSTGSLKEPWDVHEIMPYGEE